MALKFDDAGFLIGELVQSSDDMAHVQGNILTVQKDIRRNVRNIVQLLGGKPPRSTRTSSSRSENGSRSVPNESTSLFTPGRTSTTRPNRGSRGPSSEPAALTSRPSSSPSMLLRETLKPVTRDSRGRFIGGKNKQGSPSGNGPEQRSTPGASVYDGITSSAMSGLTGAVNRLSGVVSATENIDPTVNAMKEVSDVISPLGRGLTNMFGRSAERKKERWYDRIWKALKDNKPKSSTQSGAAGGGAGFFGTLGGLLGGGGLGKIGNLFKIGGLAKILAGGGKLLRKLPILGALLSGGSALWSLFGGDDDPNASPEENRKRQYHNTGSAVGMGVGGIAGAALGSLLDPILGPFGTIIGGYLGAVIGDKLGAAFGDWTKSLVDAGVPQQMLQMWKESTAFISAAFDSLATDAKKSWSAITKNVEEWWTKIESAVGSISDAISNAVQALNTWIKDKLGIDVGQIARNGVEAAKKGLSAVGDKAREIGGAAWDFARDNMVPDTIKRAVSAGSAAASQARAGYDEGRGRATNAPAPSTSFQQGARSAGTSVGKGISKILETGQGYNVVQQADGSVVKQTGARNWRNNNPGNIQYGDFAKRYGAIGSDGRFAIFPTYEAGRRAQEALLFQSQSYAGMQLTDALAKWAPPNENDTAKYQSYVLDAVGGQNKKVGEYTPEERAAILDRMQKNEGYRVGTTQTISATPSLPSVSSFSIPNMPGIASGSVPSSVPAKLPAAPDTPAAAVPAGSAAAGRTKVSVQMPNNGVSQDVTDRNVAHIVTGGIGGTQ